MSRIRKSRVYVKGNIVPLLIGAGAALLLVILVFGGEAALSTTGFCVSCHSMTYPAAELKKSSHYRGSMGAQLGCKDCHIPQGLANFHLAVATHVLDGTRAIYHELVDDYSTKKMFNRHRLRMAHKARMIMKGWDSLTCRDCHKDARPAGKSAKQAHQKMETEGATCIDCHQNLVHKEVSETDLDASLQQRMMVLQSVEEREKVEIMAAGCMKCHGVNGTDVSRETPNLACQKEEYLVKQLKAFKAAAGNADRAMLQGARYHEVMSAQAKDLSVSGMESLASYFASLSCR
jgi:cytochrome c-type protein NapC